MVMQRYQYVALFILMAVVLTVGPRFYLVGADPPPDIVPKVSEPQEFDLYDYNPLDAQFIAKAKFEAYRSDPRQLQKAKVNTARFALESRYKEFAAGRGTLDFLIRIALLLLESELAVCDNETDRIVALERHWTMMHQIEIINQARFEAGRIPVQDFAETKYFRLEAEIWLHQARAKQEKK